MEGGTKTTGRSQEKAGVVMPSASPAASRSSLGLQVDLRRGGA